jgi:hypothetical protein
MHNERLQGGRLMEAHATHSLHVHRRRSEGRLALPTLVRAGAIAGLAGGMMMAMWQMVVGAIAQDPTAVPGIQTSFWTAVTSIPSVVFGTDWFHGSFELGAVFVGLTGHLMNSIMLGVVGVGLATTLLGSRLSVAKAVAFGMMFGLILEVVVVNLIVNQVQTVNTLYTSTPEWSWFVAHAMFGATVGLVGSALLRSGVTGRREKS